MTWLKAWLFALVVTITSPLATQAEVIKLATLAPEGSPWYDALRDMAEAWKSASAGAIEIKIYAGGIAGDDPDIVRKVRLGQLQAAAITTEGLLRLVPDIMALHLPMMLRSADELNFVRDQVAPELEAQLEDRGYVVLNWADAGWARFFCKQPVANPEDLRPLKIFVWAGDTHTAKAWRDAGYKPVPLAGTDIHGGLQSGMIDCVPTVPIAALSYQWFGLAPHMTELKWAPFMGATVISARVWRRIPEDLRTRMAAIARETGIKLRERIRGLDQEAIEAMTRYGLMVHQVGPAETSLWEQGARDGYGVFRGSMISPAFLDRVEELRREYRAQVASQ
ncbi:MAG: TRAP transporter substrate-binding protein DctP [Kiloniellales bacterium]|nr:TRAP transporter substrate-binding protein DctP [Kiloniellales bacterium]